MKMKGRDRNTLCPCGSGLKYKKCCGSVFDEGNDTDENAEEVNE